MFSVILLSVIIFYLLLLLAIDRRPQRITIENQDFLILKRFLHKRLGLLNHMTLAKDNYYVFLNSNSIHTMGMNCPIRVAFLDSNFHVIKYSDPLNPGLKKVKGPKHTKHVIEMSERSEVLYPALKQLREFVCHR